MKSTNEKSDEKYEENSTDLDGVPDLCLLKYTKTKNLLYNLEFRYMKMARKCPYNIHSMSNVLIAMNPWERLPIYGEDVINEFYEAQKKGKNLLPTRPHPYGVSAQMYQTLIDKKNNQSAIVCGVSGSGKTETCKLLMRYLAMTVPSSTMESSIIEQQIIASAPILEAFGNAKTLLNNNASRYSKYMKILYETHYGYFLGLTLDTYLLETSRVTYQSKNERNFHIPYFLYKGIAKRMHQAYGIENPAKLKYTSYGGCIEVPGISDKYRFEELKECFNLMRIDESIQSVLWMIVCGIFNLGNITFKLTEHGFGTVVENTQTYVDIVAKLWAMKSQLLTDMLTTKSMRIMKKVVTQNIPFDLIHSNRDSIARTMYKQVFSYLCERIHAELYQEDEETETLFIGVLDVFGFGNFWVNSLEQFSVNFMNEKLQQLVVGYFWDMDDEQKYLKLLFKEMYNKPLIDMVENKQNGLFALLNVECKQVKPTVNRFMQQLFEIHGNNGIIKVCRNPGSGNAVGRPKSQKRKRKVKHNFVGFEIKHFADDVSYDVSKFLARNVDVMNNDTIKMFEKSTSDLLKAIVSPLTKEKKKTNIVTLFQRNIDKLFEELSSTQPHFIHCINPNNVKSSKIWNESTVEHQIRSFGFIQTWQNYQETINSLLVRGFVHNYERIEFKEYKIPPEIILVIQMFYRTTFVK